MDVTICDSRSPRPRGSFAVTARLIFAGGPCAPAKDEMIMFRCESCGANFQAVPPEIKRTTVKCPGCSIEIDIEYGASGDAFFAIVQDVPKP